MSRAGYAKAIAELREKGYVTLRSSKEIDAFHDAVNAFDVDGNRAELLRELMRLGIPADQIRRIAAGEDLPVISA